MVSYFVDNLELSSMSMMFNRKNQPDLPASLVFNKATFQVRSAQYPRAYYLDTWYNSCNCLVLSESSIFVQHLEAKPAGEIIQNRDLPAL